MISCSEVGKEGPGFLAPGLGRAVGLLGEICFWVGSTSLDLQPSLPGEVSRVISSLYF